MTNNTRPMPHCAATDWCEDCSIIDVDSPDWFHQHKHSAPVSEGLSVETWWSERSPADPREERSIYIEGDLACVPLSTDTVRTLAMILIEAADRLDELDDAIRLSRPDGMSDERWSRMRGEVVAHIEGLLAASRQRN